MEAQMVKTENALEMTRVFNAPVDRLFRAWTEPEIMNKWYFPGPNMHAVCTVDLRVGGRYEVQMVPEEGDPYIAGGVYQEIVPQEKLVFTWLWKHEDANMESLVTLLFKPIGKRQTELTLIHERFPNEEERDKHGEGWVGVLDQLEIALN
jgi:uncharacterized protein YndB with AHSA1/START domain